MITVPRFFYKLSRYWNWLVLKLSIKLINSTWDISGWNGDIIQDAANAAQNVLDIIGPSSL